MTNQQAGLFIALLGLTFLVAAIIILICDKTRIKKYSAQTMGTVTGHKWIHAEYSMYPVSLLSYTVDGQTYKCRQRYRAIITHTVPHAKQDWVLDEKYRLLRYRARNCDKHVDPIEDWFPVGSQMPVHYVPGKPKKAYCGSLVNLSIMWIVMGATGIFMALLGVLLMMFL